jgi:hypothetical protein
MNRFLNLSAHLVQNLSEKPKLVSEVLRDQSVVAPHMGRHITSTNRFIAHGFNEVTSSIDQSLLCCVTVSWSGFCHETTLRRLEQTNRT